MIAVGRWGEGVGVGGFAGPQPSIDSSSHLWIRPIPCKMITF